MDSSKKQKHIHLDDDDDDDDCEGFDEDFQMEKYCPKIKKRNQIFKGMAK